MRTVAVVGTSLAGLRAIETLRREGYDGRIVAIGGEPHLPYDRPPAGVHAAESGGSARLELSVTESDRIHRAAMRNGLTVNTMVQGAWALLLSRYSGERDVVFGTTVSGRPPELPGVESMVGMFINTVPTRVTVHSGQPVARWLQALQAEQSESRRFDFVSLAELQGWSEVSAAVTLFDSILVFENYPFDDDALAAHGLRMHLVQDLEPTNYPLTVVVSPGDQLAASFDYDPALFDPATVERLAGHLETVLAGIAADPDRRLGRLPLLGPAQRNRVLCEWNATTHPVPDLCSTISMWRNPSSRNPATAIADFWRSGRTSKDWIARSAATSSGRASGRSCLPCFSPSAKSCFSAAFRSSSSSSRSPV